jgi:hypothetical protein
VIRAHGPTHDGAREEIEDDGQVQPALLGPEIGDVGDPRRVGRGDGEVPGQYVGGDGQLVIGGGRGSKPAPAAGTEPMLTHQPRHPLAAHPVPATPELGGHPRAAIALAALGVDRLYLDPEPQILLGPGCCGPRVSRVEARAGHFQDPA